ncbi:MAG TPA: hypothetical protein VLF41_01020 [Candidatus Nanoarchaeia archaeon]|nr:hypothetical protein [Candidatus Nanoarchaeia archaeon]
MKAVQVKNQTKVRNWAVAVLVLASLAWTIYRWSGVDELKHRLGLHQAIAFAIAAAVSELLFIGGAVVLALSLGKAVFAGTGTSPARWAKALLNARTEWKESAQRLKQSRTAYWGLYMNWLGALGTTGVVPILAIAFVLPFGSWGLMAPFVVDIVATCSIRQPLLRRLQAAGRAIT